MTWWLKPAFICLLEKFVVPDERQFQVGIRVPSSIKDPGCLARGSKGWIQRMGEELVECFLNAVDGRLDGEMGGPEGFCEEFFVEVMQVVGERGFLGKVSFGGFKYVCDDLSSILSSSRPLSGW